VASLSQGRTAAAQCGLFTHKSVPVIFEPPCIFNKARHGKILPVDEWQFAWNVLTRGLPKTARVPGQKFLSTSVAAHTAATHQVWYCEVSPPNCILLITPPCNFSLSRMEELAEEPSSEAFSWFSGGSRDCAAGGRVWLIPEMLGTIGRSRCGLRDAN